MNYLRLLNHTYLNHGRINGNFPLILKRREFSVFVMALALRIYSHAYFRHPMSTCAVSTGTLMATGDCICQLVIERTHNYDFRRTGRFLGFGLFIGGPIFRVWYKTIDKVFRGTKYAPVKMVIADQGLFAPVFLPFFLGTMGFLRGETVDEFKNQVKKDFIPVMKANYKVWPAVQICNFMFVPLQHRVLAVNVVSIFWNTYLAWFAETKNKDNLNLIEQELILHEAVHESHDTHTTKSTSPTTVTESVAS
ncbi:mitochondrial inner membrane protein Mpv17-like isoform X1 [Mytilus edulis]|uniref:mitochondrial inner membrane protein Mpv17-like isoform X1 n=1 Tax=Mytilus edulis TaxID=6550 RepID=UPI0039F0CB1B